MSVQSDQSRVEYSGNGSIEEAYPVPFHFFADEDIRVVVVNSSGEEATLVLGQDYVVSGAGEEDGGSLLTLEAWGESDRIVIFRQLEARQLTSYAEGGSFPASSHERALDRLTMLVQQVERAVKGSLRVRESDGEIESAAKVASSILGIDAEGVPLFRTPDELVSLLNLSTIIADRPMMTFANAGERTSAVPNFAGQLGTQRDTKALYLSTGTTAGNWAAVIPGAASILLAMLADGILANSTTGRLKMADGYLSADAEGRAKMADAFVTLAKIGAGMFTADGTGRGKFETGFVNSSLLAPGAAVANMPAGTVIQTVFATYDSLSTISTTGWPNNNTVPTTSHGSQVMAATITPTSASSKILANLIFNGTTSSSSEFGMGLFRNSETSALSAVRNFGQGYTYQMVTTYLDSPGTTSSTEYKMRAGGSGATLYVNGSSGGVQMYGGAGRCSILLQEIKA